MKTTIKWTLVLILGIIMWVFVIPKPIDEYDRIEKEMIHEMEVHWDPTCDPAYSIYLDSIEEYNSFDDVPAGMHGDTIEVDGLIYQIDKEETIWVLINSEE